MSWPPEDPRRWGGWAPWDPRWGPYHRASWGYRQPVYPNQLGWRLPTGGPPGPGQTSLGIALLLFVLGPATILARVAGQALLRATGLRWWKLLLLSSFDGGSRSSAERLGTSQMCACVRPNSGACGSDRPAPGWASG